MKQQDDIYSDARTAIISEYKAMCAKTPESLMEKAPAQKGGFWDGLIPNNIEAVKNMFGAVMESEYLKQLVNSDIVKTAAQGAAVGAVIAIPIPLVGPAFGGAIGALATTSIYVIKGGKK